MSLVIELLHFATRCLDVASQKKEQVLYLPPKAIKELDDAILGIIEVCPSVTMDWVGVTSAQIDSQAILAKELSIDGYKFYILEKKEAATS